MSRPADTQPCVPSAADKHALRIWARDRAAALPHAYTQAASDAICARLQALAAYRAAATVFCFVGMQTEVDTRAFLEAVWADGKTLCVPRCEADGTMTARRVEDWAALAPGKWGIWEPSAAAPVVESHAIDLCVVPCLAADPAKRRLGQGGGYYDRFLPTLRPDAAAVLVCRQPLVVPCIPCEEHDVACALLVTETQVIG